MTNLSNRRKIPVCRSGLNYQRQSGVILAVTLIVLVILLVTSVAMIRSFTASVGIAGSLANRRDLMNQGERAVATTLAAFAPNTGPFTQGLRFLNQKTYNYSACQLPVDVHGVPTILSDDANFENETDLSGWNDSNCNNTQVAQVANDIGPDPTNHVTVRYVVDRLCVASGDGSNYHCTTTPAPAPPAGPPGTPPVVTPGYPVYRISIRATDERGSRTYLQTTFSN